MYKRGDKEYVVDMFLSCQKILDYTQGMTFEDFEMDSKTIDAVIRNIEILGEAAKNVSNELRAKYPEIDWSIIARTRDKLIHFYFGIDTTTLWKIIRDDIPELLDQLETILKNENWKYELES